MEKLPQLSKITVSSRDELYSIPLTVGLSLARNWSNFYESLRFGCFMYYLASHRQDISKTKLQLKEWRSRVWANPYLSTAKMRFKNLEWEFVQYQLNHTVEIILKRSPAIFIATEWQSHGWDPNELFGPFDLFTHLFQERNNGMLQLGQNPLLVVLLNNESRNPLGYKVGQNCDIIINKEWDFYSDSRKIVEQWHTIVEVSASKLWDLLPSRNKTKSSKKESE